MKKCIKLCSFVVALPLKICYTEVTYLTKFIFYVIIPFYELGLEVNLGHSKQTT
jgi:hypothetical protein